MRILWHYYNGVRSLNTVNLSQKIWPWLDLEAISRADMMTTSPTTQYSVPGVMTPAQPGGPLIDSCHQIPCKFNGKWVGTLCNREAKGARRPPDPLS